MTPRLTKKEAEICTYLATGESNKQIAKHFNNSELTIKRHIQAMLDKTKTRNRTHLAVLFDRGLFEVANMIRSATPPGWEMRRMPGPVEYDSWDRGLQDNQTLWLARMAPGEAEYVSWYVGGESYTVCFLPNGVEVRSVVETH